MKKITIIALLIVSISANAQLTGIKTIPGDYATIAAAATDLNTVGVGAGGVTFNVAAGHTETGNISITATGTAANQIVFQKNGAGANPTITAGTGTGIDAIIKLMGSDYITFDGLTLIENTANNPLTRVEKTEHGFAFFKPTQDDGCQYNTIKNCNISLNKTFFESDPFWGAIYQAQAFYFMSGATTFTNLNAAPAATSIAAGHSYNIIQNNTVTNCSAGFVLNANRNTSTLNFLDHHNQILNNSFTCGGQANPISHISVYTAVNTTIDGNTFLCDATQTGAVTPINYTVHTKSGVTITNNTVQMNYNYGSIFVVAGIQVSAAGTGIANSFSDLVLIKGNSVSGNIIRAYTGINVLYVDNLKIESNTINLSSHPSCAGTEYGINVSSAFNTNPVQVISKNIIQGNVSATTDFVYGIYASGLSNSCLVDSNKVINNNGNEVIGITVQIGNCTVTNNLIANSTANQNNSFTGLTVAAASIMNVWNNYIGCTANAPSGTGTFKGISTLYNGATLPVKIYHNTVYLAGGGTTNNSAAFNYNGTPPLHLRNNIFVNNMNSGITGRVFAFLNAVPVSSSNLFSKNNLFYAGVPSERNAIYGLISSGGYQYSDSTMQLYKLRVCNKDSNSVTENPPFLSLDYTNPNYLHINPAVASLVNGRGFATAEVTVDYDGDTRNATTPDIGADELNGIDGVLTTPLTAPVLWLKADAGAYTDAGTTLATNNQTIQQWNDQSCSGFNATQADASKRPTLHQYAFNGKPALWFDGANGNYFLNNITSNPVVAGGERTVFVYGKRDCNTHAGGGVGGTLFTFRRTPLINTLTYGANTYGTPVYIYSDANGVGNNNANIASAMIDTALNQFTITYKVPAAGSQISCYINGLGQTVNQAGGAVVAETGANGFTVGHREDQPDLDWSGWIAEVIVYDRALTDGERIAVENYLQTKYGKTAIPPQFTGLPATNPYSSNIDIQDATWRHSYNSGDNSKIIASVKANCFDLGTINGVVYNDAAAGQYNGQRYMRRHYVINPTLDPAGTKRVRLYYTNADFADLQTYVPSLTTASQLVVTKYDGTNEDGVFDPSGGVTFLIPSSQITTGTVFGVNYLEFDITGFSEFWIHTGFAALPLNFISFSVQKCTGNTVCLNWKTANEQNVSHFEIQRSVDGRTFTAFATKAANNQPTNIYNIVDDIALLQSSGQIYYRIKQIDADGRFSYTNIQLVKLTDKLTISIYPNPSSDVINIVGWNTIRQMQLYDVSGKKINEWQQPQPTINLSKIGNGIYILKAQLKTGEIVEQKIIVQH